MTTFDKEVAWNGEFIVFWANKGKERIRCAVPRKTINEIMGFTNATSETIGDKRVQIKDMLAPRALEKILRNDFAASPSIKTATLALLPLPPSERRKACDQPQAAQRVAFWRYWWSRAIQTKM
jgi:hypothetical protein